VAAVSGTRTAAWMPNGPDRPTRPFRFGSEDRVDPDPALRPGALVGERYRIVQLLGEGGMGRVYEAEHTVLRRRVALKLLRREAQARAEDLARFQQEALAASRISTPQIVGVADFASHVGPAGQQTYMVMELLVGESLEAWIEHSGRLDHALELLAQLCDGLAAAHQAGVIHRDIKPANVFCCAPGPRLKILDFGIAKFTDGDRGFQTQEGSLLGTPYYVAPERVMGAQLTPAADIYSVGVILYELLTGNVPFVAESFVGILARHVHTEPLDPRQAAPDRLIPDVVAGLCVRLLAKDPARRPSAAALAVELRAMLVAHEGALAGVRTGPRDDGAGVGADTHVLAEADAGRSMSERTTAAPSREAALPVAPIAHAPGPTASVVAPITAPIASSGGIGPAGSPVRGSGQTGRRVAFALSAAALFFACVSRLPIFDDGGVGAGGGERATPGLRSSIADSTPAPVVERVTVDEGPARSDPPRAAAPKAERVAELPAKAKAEAEPAPSPASAPVAKPAKKKAHAKPEPVEPEPVEPEPVAPEPVEREPAPTPSDAKPDPDLPTIKDDVYD
jgi:eukaryotic-like serine/threonine-protein kinase